MGLDESDLKSASKNDLLELIFMPGFSTAEQVTDLSGRGVGMDVVRTNLKQIRGEIQVDTQPESGTTFTITVPFTLSVVRVLLVESSEMLLAFPTSAIEEMLRLQPDEILQTVGKEVLNWQGAMVPLIRLSDWFQFSRSHPLADTEAIPVINEPTVLLIAQGENLVGILIDRYWGEQEVTIRQVEGTLAMPPGFSGCTILGDGRVVPLVDAMALLRWIDNFGSSQLSSGLSSTLATVESESDGTSSLAHAEIVEKSTILVVDDSINVRRFLALTLEKAGYRVEQAKDGQDALEKLKGGLTVQAVISDIEMPRLDGYGFLAHVKSDANCQHLPIVMLTSRSGDKHRQLAMNLGASAYFSKPFREPELLKTLEQLTQKQPSLR
jgi:chemosensory pili system protein ChpA (sensor histidine kinase/response regulator)